MQGNYYGQYAKGILHWAGGNYIYNNIGQCKNSPEKKI